MKVRLRQPIREARQWDGDLDAFVAWFKSRTRRHASPRVEGVRLRVEDVRFVFNLDLGDWLIAALVGDGFQKIRKDDFEAQYDRVVEDGPRHG